jgi:hypothetical protein
MPIPYPSDPAVGDSFTYLDVLYTWNGVAWISEFTKTPSTVGAVAVEAPITNSGTPTAPVIGISQGGLTIAQSQVTNLVSDLAGKASTSDLTAGLALKANLAGGNAFTAAQTITGSVSSEIPLLIKGASGQSVNIFEVQNNSGTGYLRVRSGGQFGVGSLITGVGAAINNDQFGSATVALLVRGAASQTANLQEWQNSAGSVLAQVTSNGNLITSGQVRATESGIFGDVNQIANTRLSVYTRGVANRGMVIQGTASQTANLQEWQNSAGTANLRISSIGDINGTIVNGSYPTTFNLMTGHNPEGKLTANPMLINDLAYARLRGSTFTWTGLTPSNADIDAMFNASSSFWNVAAGSFPATQVIQFTSPVTLTYGAFFGISFGNSGWAVRDITLEAFSEGVWKTVNSTTSNSSEVFMGAIPTNAGVGTTQFRITLATPLGAAVRITHIFAYNFASPLAKQIYLGRDGGTMFGDIQGASNLVGFAFGRFGSSIAFTDSTALRVTPSATTNVGAIIRGQASQTADLQQWQNSAGTVLSEISASGSFYVNSNNNTIGIEFLGTAGTQLITANGNDLLLRPRFDVLFAPADSSGRLRPSNDNTSDLGTSGQRWKTLFASGATLNSLTLTGTTSPITLNGQVGALGQVLTSQGAGATPTWTTVSGGGSFTGGTLTGNLTLAVGTTTLSPLTFQSGTNLTTVTAGANEYDGTVYYQTSNTSPGRALKTQNYYYVASADWYPDFSSSSSAKSLLGTATRGITVAAGTTYEYELKTTIQHDFATNSGIEASFDIFNTTVSGSPVVSDIMFVDFSSNTSGFTTASAMSSVRTTNAIVVSAGISSGSRYTIVKATGIIRITGTGTTKIYPGIFTSASSGDNGWTIGAGTTFKMTPIGNGTVTTVGTWA